MRGLTQKVRRFLFFRKAEMTLTQIVIAILAVIILVIGVVFIGGSLLNGGGDILQAIKDIFRFG